jgi:hypothetical protein
MPRSITIICPADAADAPLSPVVICPGSSNFGVPADTAKNAGCEMYGSTVSPADSSPHT